MKFETNSQIKNVSQKIITEYEQCCLWKKQMVIDKNFIYCKNPNPESKQVFQLSIELDKKEKANILLTTDPNADPVV